MGSKTLQKQVLELSKQERARLAHVLIDSLNPEANFESEEDWSQELEKRINRYQQGQSSTTSWTKVKKNAQDLLNK